MSRISIDVGGVIHHTTRETLRGSEMLDGLAATEGPWYIDRDPALFPIILNRLRGWSIDACLSAAPQHMLEALQAEASFYGVDVFGEVRFVNAQGTYLRVGEWDINNCSLFDLDRKDPARRVFHIHAPADRALYIMHMMVTDDYEALSHLPAHDMSMLMCDLELCVKIAAGLGADREGFEQWSDGVQNQCRFIVDSIYESRYKLEGHSKCDWMGAHAYLNKLGSTDIARALDGVSEAIGRMNDDGGNLVNAIRSCTGGIEQRLGGLADVKLIDYGALRDAIRNKRRRT